MGKFHCKSCCWYSVLVRGGSAGGVGGVGGVGVGGEVSGETIQAYPYSHCTFHAPEFTKSSNKFYRTNQPSGKSLWPT